MSNNALKWQDNKIASKISNNLENTKEIFFWQKFFSCVRARKFEISLAILPSCHLKAFFDILRQKNDNDNEDENLSYITV